MSLKIERFLFPVLALSLSLWAGAVPTGYKAVADMVVRPMPAVPSIGPAGSIVRDPTYGTRILRVTDGDTQPNAKNTVFLTPAGGFVHNWNADSTMFYVYGSGGILPYHFDAATMKATRIAKAGDPSGGLRLPYNAALFSYRRPNILYGGTGVQIVEYDFNTGKTQVVFDAAKAVGGQPGGAYAPSVSDDDSKLCLAFGNIQDQYPYVAVLDRNTGQYKVLNTMHSMVDGHPTANPLGWGIHSAYLDRSGRYVIIGKGSGPHNKSDWTVWDTATDQVYDILAHWSGHDAAGFGVRVNESGYCCSFYEEDEYSVRSLDKAGIDQPKYLIPANGLPTPHIAMEYGHFSWNNAQPKQMVPVVGSHYRNIKDAKKPWRAWDGEIVAVATDGSGTVWRFAHHFSTFDGSNFWDSPRGNVSQDGRWFLFTSNWGRKLGKNAFGGGARQDVFLVELPAAGSNAAAVNLLKNPGFESGGTGWQGANQPNQMVTGARPRSGHFGLLLTAGANNPTVYQEVPITAGGQYSVSGWLDASGTKPGGFGVILAWLNAQGQVVRRDMVGWGTAGGWKYIGTTRTAPAGAVKLRVRPYGEPGSGIAYFDDLRVY